MAVNQRILRLAGLTAGFAFFCPICEYFEKSLKEIAQTPMIFGQKVSKTKPLG
jgi:hypothetical protein